MTRLHHANRGVGALSAYVVALVVVSLGLYELGARPFGYTPLSARLLGPDGPPPAEVRRFGKMLVKTDEYNQCREYSVDNRTQQLVEKGVVPCDPEREAKMKDAGRTKMDSFRDSFVWPR